MRWLGLLSVCGALLLAGCGFQLKGKQAGLEQLSPMFVTGDAFTESPIIKAVRADLRNSGVEIAQWRSQAAHILFVGAEESSLRTASYDVLVRAAENTMIMEATYELRDARGKVLAGPSRVYAERLYEYDVQGVTSSAAQLSIIVRELQERLGEQIVRRLAAVDPDQEPDQPESGDEAR